MILHQILKDYNIILASQSPRRRELLEGTNIDFVVADKFECEEIYDETIDKKDVAEYLSKLKAETYPTLLTPKDILITADTIVLIDDNTIFGKPSSKQEAIDMIETLSGKTHLVITGVTLKTVNIQKSFSVSTKVIFSKLSHEEIEYYVDKYSPYDKAGSYGIQEWIGYIGVEAIEGSFYNVMGLPINCLYKHLKNIIK